MSSVTTSKKAAVKKPITLESAKQKSTSAIKKSNATYWKFDGPSRLSLGGARKHVAKNHMAGQVVGQAQPNMSTFIYYPDLRVAGTIGQIVELLTTTIVDGRRVPITQPELLVGAKQWIAQGGDQKNFKSSVVAFTDPMQLYRASYDPLNQADAVFIDALKPKTTKEAAEPIEKWLAIGESLASAAKVTKATKGKGKKATTENASSNLSTRVNDFNAAMDSLSQGLPVEKVFNVTKFNVASGTNASREDAPKSDRSHAIQPVVQGRRMPIVVQPHSLNNLRDYVNSVVRASRYAQYADEILRSAEAINAGKNSLGGGLGAPLAASTMTFAQPISMLPQTQTLAQPMSMLPQTPMTQTFAQPISMLPQATALPRATSLSGALTPRSGNLSPPPMSAANLPPMGTQTSPLRGLGGLGGLGMGGLPQ